jgi:hypothetical protein
MSDTNYGAVTWDEDVEVGAPRSNDTFMRLVNGPNIVRMITPPFQYWSHKWKPEGAKGFGEKVYCSKFHGSCPLCDGEVLAENGKVSKPKRRWFVGIIDRATNTYKVLDMGVGIYQKVREHSRDEDWGDPTGYDFNIIVNKQGGATNYYNVLAKPKKPLSDSDIEIKQNVKLEGLKRKCTPPSPEAVQKRIDNIIAKLGGTVISQELNEEVEDDGEKITFVAADSASA